MPTSLKAKVNNSFDFDIDTEVISKLDISEVSAHNYHLLHNNKSFHTRVIASNFNKKVYEVSVNNNLYRIELYNELDNLINKMGFSIGAKKTISSITAPMPGLILEISVTEGQEVKKNDSLLILEAMKMENSIVSPIDGVIKSIHAKEGDAVDKNQLIIEFE
ncbi:MAG: acetyl-CoA carboxylase biotin carboxyl carrier protein subunit [Jejuia sp.]